MSAVDKVSNLINEVTAELASLGSKVGSALLAKAEKAIADGKSAITQFQDGGILEEAEAVGELAEAAAELAEVLVELAAVVAVA